MRKGATPTSAPPRAKQNSEYAAFARRMIRGWGRRAEAGDHLVLGDMLAARAAMDEAIDQAVAVLTDPAGPWKYTWADIGAATGMHRHHAWRKWGKPR